MASKGRKLAKLIVNDSGRQENTVLDGDYVKLPVGTTAERPTGVAGYIRFNTDEASLEQFDGTSWTEMAKPPIISTLSYSGSATAVGLDGGETVTISGTNFTAGVNVQFGTTWATAVTRTNSTSLSVTVPALSAGDYDVVVINGDGMQATLTDGLSVNAAPTFTTAAGSLGEFKVDQAITAITLVATEDDSGAITYAVTTGALPTGLSLSGADITGTPTGYSAETTANFTITATDDENQTTTRNFSLTVLVGFYDYEITNAIKFDPTLSTPSHLDRTPSADGNNDTFTLSLWVKRSKISSTQQFYSSRVDNSNGFFGYFGGNDAIEFYHPAYNYVAVTTTTAAYRDVGAWYHIVYAIDTTQATASDRAKLYVNGELVTDRTGNYPRLDEDQFYHRSGVKQTIGTNPDQSYGTDGYVANVYSIDGQQLAASDFGEYKNDVWVPKEYTGTYGSQGFHLDFSNASNIGEDQSGNNNDFAYDTVSADVLVPDTPTNNFATGNPLIYRPTYGWATLSKGNLQQTEAGLTTSWGGIISNMYVSSGKYYAEVYCQGNTDGNVGLMNVGTYGLSGYLVQNPDTATGSFMIYDGNNGLFKYNGSNVSEPSATDFMQNKVIGIAVDGDNGTVSFYKDGTIMSSNLTNYNITSNAATDAFAFISLLPDSGSGRYITWNFGQDSSFAGLKTAQGNTDSKGQGDFYYTPPSGYLALCNENLPNNTFDLNTGEKPSDHFKAVLYSAAASNINVSVGFQPDLIWIKNRSNANSSSITDSVRGVDKWVISDYNGAERNDASNNSGNARINSIVSDGFQVNNNDNHEVNSTTNSYNYVAWCWKAGGTPVSNTDGAITSSVSVNTAAGFSIVTYTGNGSATNVGHGLSQAPEFILAKERSGASSWVSYHPDQDNGGGNGENGYMHLDTSGGYAAYSQIWNSTKPTNSIIHLGTAANVNSSGNNYVAYCWHSVPGFSKVASYTGNGNANGTFVYTEFKPALVLIRYTGGGEGWNMQDATRYPDNGLDAKVLRADLSNSEATSGASKIDFLSNGFKHRASDPSLNGNGYNYIYIAFAEDPFKYGNAR